MLRFRYRPEDDANFKPPLQGPRKLVQVKIPTRSSAEKQEIKNNANSSTQTSPNLVDVNKTMQKSGSSSFPQQIEIPGTLSNESTDRQSSFPPETQSEVIYHNLSVTKLTPKIFPDNASMSVDFCKNVSTSHKSSWDNNISQSSLQQTTESDQNIPTARCVEDLEEQLRKLRPDSNTYNNNNNDTYNNKSALLQIAATAATTTAPRRKSCFSILSPNIPLTESGWIPACSPSPVTMETNLPGHHIQSQETQQKGKA